MTSNTFLISEYKDKLNRLLVIASLGILFDGLTTILGASLGIEEANPIAGAVGLPHSLLIRAGAIIVLYFLIGRINTRKYARWTVASMYLAVVITWFAVLLNISAIIFVSNLT